MAAHRKAMYKNALINNWHFIRNYILDNSQGEWLWGVDRDGKKMAGQDKVGIWKCPYHNTQSLFANYFKGLKPNSQTSVVNVEVYWYLNLNIEVLQCTI